MQAEHSIVRSGPSPLHAILLSFPIALFTGALASDITYLRTEEIQWTNFSAWLIAGALVFNGLVLAWSLVSLLFGLRRGPRVRRMIYFVVLAALFAVGLINAFQHSRDGWSSVGTLGLILSILSTVLALAAGVVAHSNLFRREVA